MHDNTRFYYSKLEPSHSYKRQLQEENTWTLKKKDIVYALCPRYFFFLTSCSAPVEKQKERGSLKLSYQRFCSQIHFVPFTFAQNFPKMLKFCVSRNKAMKGKEMVFQLTFFIGKKQADRNNKCISMNGSR